MTERKHYRLRLYTRVCKA